MTEITIQVDAPATVRHTARANPWHFSRTSYVVILWTLFLVAVAFFSIAIANRLAITYIVATLALFALPGFFVVPIFFEPHPATRVERAIISTVFGIAISSYAAVLVGFLYSWNPRTISLALVGLCLVCAAVGKTFQSRLRLTLRPWARFDYGILAGIGAVLVLFSANPALHLGKLTSSGYAYTWLYGFDFVYRADVIQAMTVHLPPDWFWMSGVPLRMYLVGYAVPAFAYAASGKTIAIHSVLLLTTFFCGYLMLASLYIFLRTLFSDAKVLLPTVFVTLFAYSYYWIYDVARSLFLPPGHGLFGSISGVSHHLQRTLLVEPQAALATSLLLVVMSLLVLVKYRLNDFALAVFLGACLAVSFGMEAMQGLLAIAWFGLFYFARFVLRKSTPDELGPFLAAVASCGIVGASFFALGMYQRSTSHLAPVSFNPWLAEFGLAYFAIEFGPLLFFGVWGVIRWWRGSREDFGWSLLLLGAITVLQVLFVFQKPPARMADRLLPFVLIPFVAYLFRGLWSSSTVNRVYPEPLGAGVSSTTETGSLTTRLQTRPAIARPWLSPRHLLLALIVLLAVPTFFTDIFFASNINNSYDTRYVRPEDMQACQWIRQNLPETAVIQGDYDYFSGPDRGLYLSLIASFAQRPQLLGWTTNAAYVVDNGWPIARQRRTDIDTMLGATDIQSVAAVLHKYSVDYLYLGPLELARHPKILSLVQSAPSQFRQVYSQNGVSIFRYAGN